MDLQDADDALWMARSARQAQWWRRITSPNAVRRLGAQMQLPNSHPRHSKPTQDPIPQPTRLLDRIDQSRLSLASRRHPAGILYPRNMGRLLAMLLKREVVTREGRFWRFIRACPNTWDKEPDPKIIDVLYANFG